MNRLFCAVLAITGIALLHSPKAISQADLKAVAADFSKLEDTWDIEISPDGNTLAMGCTYEGQRAVCITPIAGDMSPAAVPPPKGTRLSSYYWASNQHVILIVNDTEVLEDTSSIKTRRIVRALSYNAKTQKTVLLLSDFRGFTNTANVVSLLADKPNKVLMALRISAGEGASAGTNLKTKSASTQYVTWEVDLDTGKKKRKDAVAAISSQLFDPEGRSVFRAIYTEDTQDFKINAGKRKTIYKNTEAAMQPLYLQAVSEEGDLIVWSSGESVSGGHARGTWKMSAEDGTLSRIQVGDFEVRSHSPVVDPHTKLAVGYYYNNDLTGQVFSDKALANIQKALKNALEGHEIRLLSWSKDRNRFIFTAEKVGRPTDFYFFDKAATQISLISRAYEAAGERTLGQKSAIRYEASDGFEVEAYLTLPEGKTREDGPFPTLLLPHGGPDAADDGSYDWWSQAYAAAGYAVLQPNFRGSSGYGAEYREAGFGEFGGKMVTDVVDGLKYLEDEGLAQPGGACAVGASYGGYSALMTPLLRPNEIKCVISVNGLTDPIAVMGEWRRAGVNGDEFISYWEQYVGPLFADASQHRQITPIDRVREYKTPVLLIHGDEDTRVEFSHFRAFRSAAGDAPWFSSYVMRGEDHFLGTEKARKEVLSQSLEFLARHHPVE